MSLARKRVVFFLSAAFSPKMKPVNCFRKKAVSLMFGNHSFCKFAKFSEKVRFLTPDTHTLRVRIRG